MTNFGTLLSHSAKTFHARVLLIECSFLKPEDRDRARDYEHLHLQDFLERAALFQNEVIVLTWLHLARRDVLTVHPRDDPAGAELPTEKSA